MQNSRLLREENSNVIEARLIVESRELTLTKLSELLDRQPDTGHERGSLSPFRKVPREHACWSIKLEWPTEVHGGTQGLADAIESLGMPLAARIAILVTQGCGVQINVVQELTENTYSHGIHLTSGAIRWMGVADASIDIDQYVSLDTEVT